VTMGRSARERMGLQASLQLPIVAKGAGEGGGASTSASLGVAVDAVSPWDTQGGSYEEMIWLVTDSCISAGDIAAAHFVSRSPDGAALLFAQVAAHGLPMCSFDKGNKNSVRLESPR